jgi:hypothetical protein
MSREHACNDFRSRHQPIAGEGLRTEV